MGAHILHLLAYYPPPPPPQAFDQPCLIKVCLCGGRDLQDSIVKGRLQPELALLNAAVVSLPNTEPLHCPRSDVSSCLTASFPQTPDLFPLQVAAWKALTAELRGKLITKTLHSELVFNIAGSSHVRKVSAAYYIVSNWCLTQGHDSKSYCDADLGKLQAVWGQR